MYVPDVELEVSLLAEGVFLLGVSGLPADTGVDVITWGVSVGPFTVPTYMQSTYIYAKYIKLHIHIHTLHAFTLNFEFDTTHADGMHLLCLCIRITYTENSAK